VQGCVLVGTSSQADRVVGSIPALRSLMSSLGFSVMLVGSDCAVQFDVNGLPVLVTVPDDPRLVSIAVDRQQRRGLYHTVGSPTQGNYVLSDFPTPHVTVVVIESQARALPLRQPSLGSRCLCSSSACTVHRPDCVRLVVTDGWRRMLGSYRSRARHLRRRTVRRVARVLRRRHASSTALVAVSVHDSGEQQRRGGVGSSSSACILSSIRGTAD
jgi:hypothetical protein